MTLDECKKRLAEVEAERAAITENTLRIYEKLAQAVEALRKIEQGTTGEADPDTGELIEVWMATDDLQEIARATLAQIGEGHE
jgi:hypothetical protein